jgi:hypothetical protein
MRNGEELNTEKNNKMVGITAYLSVITLNVNGLYSPIKTRGLVDWTKIRLNHLLSI